MTATKKATGKLWTEENTAIVVEAYNAELEANGVEAAADNDFLKSLAEKVGAPSEKSVRGKLTTAGVYQKPEHVASAPKSNPIRKEHYVRAIAHTLGIDADTLDSMKNAKADALQALADSLGVQDVAEAAKRDFSIEPETVVDNFANARNL